MKKVLTFILLLSVTPWFLKAQFKAGITSIIASDYLFYSGTGEHGVFLLSFLPLILTGFYQLFLSRNLLAKTLPLFMLLVIPLPILSFIATLGFIRLSSNKLFFTTNIIWILYEGLRLYHMFLTHKI